MGSNCGFIFLTTLVYERKDIKFREDIKHLKSKEKKLVASCAQEKKKIKEKATQLKACEEDIGRYPTASDLS